MQPFDSGPHESRFILQFASPFKEKSVACGVAKHRQNFVAPTLIRAHKSELKVDVAQEAAAWAGGVRASGRGLNQALQDATISIQVHPALSRKDRRTRGGAHMSNPRSLRDHKAVHAPAK